MGFNPKPFDVLEGLKIFGITFGVFLAVAVVLGFAFAAAGGGNAGISRFLEAMTGVLTDTVRSSFRRIFAVARLTFREAIRRKALAVFVVFAVLFMFAGWFISDANARADLQVKVHVGFVLKAILWLLMPVMLLLSCWGIPEDIRLRSLHTVVTKPVRRNEVLLGRMLGFAAVGTLLVVVMGVVGYVWIKRQVPPEANMICRVPVYGSLAFKDPEGNDTKAGINVGDIWEHRSYVHGATKAAAIWRFTDLDPDEFENGMKLEARFEAFRTHKGIIKEGLRAQFTFKNEKTGKEFRYPRTFTVREYKGGNVIEVDRKFDYVDPESNETEQVDFVQEVLNDGKLMVIAQCLDPGQLLGMAQSDMFISLPHRSFAVGYFKAVLGIWLMMLLVVMLGVTASTFVKGPVATLLTFSIILVGLTFRDFATRVTTGDVKGSGTFESMIRLYQHKNPQIELNETVGTEAAQFVDPVFNQLLSVVLHSIPDFRPFQLGVYPANGFDVPFAAGLLPAIVVVVAFLLPCLLIGYFSLSLRELEAK
jgi:hypothetical protein